MWAADEVPENFYRVSIKALIFDDMQRLLIFIDRHGEAEIPGGGWDHAEELEDCVRRELQEEVGAVVTAIEPQVIVYKAATASGLPKICVAVHVSLASATFTPNVTEVAEVRYVTKQQFLDVHFQRGEQHVQAHADRIWALVEKLPQNQ